MTQARAAAPTRGQWLLAAAAILLAALATRWTRLGDPLIQVDENFYLLVGDRMWHGALPYVDIWDRKPVGLFVLYAAIRLLGGVGIYQYQIVALLAAAGTGFLVARIAARMTSLTAATVAGIFYVMLLGLAGGSGGQGPVFYNLLTAGAALATLRALEAGPDPSAIRRRGALAMALMGLGLQLKYSVVFEGIFFGCALLGLSWRSHRSAARLAADGALWVALAALPTAAAFLWYAAAGQADAWLYANLWSIAARGHEPAPLILKRLAKTWTVLHLPIFAILLAVVLEPWRASPAGPRTFKAAMAWFGAALFGYLIFGTYFDHYALPLMLPIAVCAAPLFGYRPKRVGLVAAVLLLALAFTANQILAGISHKRRGTQAELGRMAALIRPRLKGGCLYIVRGESLLYHLTGACMATRWIFPSHLTLKRESQAIGVEPLGEIRRIFATRPTVVVDTPLDDMATINPPATALARSFLARDYRLVGRVQAPKGRRYTLIYERLPGR